MSTEGLRILVDQARGFLDRQWDAFESQDRKIAGLFGVSTAIVTVVPAFVTGFGRGISEWELIPFLAASATYVVSLYLHWQAYRPSEVHSIGNARAYYEEWTDFSEDEILKWTLLDLAQQQDANTANLETKEKRMRSAAVAVGAEAVFLALGALLVAT